MLKAIEMAGFKSFADKTRFDFPDGITVIVGPNGSGKSNVVDAIKWVLGAQSAKSLRGKDMIDVIFKGSESAGRKPGNSAEATLVFDNSRSQFPVDSPEVHVTRRVYRSGEGEYLINLQPCRLKDIKDLFRGTGVGVDAYSLIEQGKVDRMLQASPKDRRIIFEEAAGISRFKVKKTEALRRLQRVDQNLLRLGDIVDEVHQRLETLKSQASKAHAYREMTQRLQALRLRLGATDYQELNQRITTQTTTLESLSAEQNLKQADLEQARHSAQQADLALHRVAEQCQQVEGSLQEILQRIAVDQNQQTTLRERHAETVSEKARIAARLIALRKRTGSLQLELNVAIEQVEQATAAVAVCRDRTQKSHVVHHELTGHVQAHALRHDALRKQHVVLLRELSEQATVVSQLKSRHTELQLGIESARQSLEKTSRTELGMRRQAEQAATEMKQIHTATQDASDKYQAAQRQLEEYRRLLASRQEDSAVLQARLEGARERLVVLERLQQHLEGVDSGVRHFMQLAKQHLEPAWQSVRGLVAELLECEVKLAPLIETALGGHSQAVALRDGQIIELLRDGVLQIEGRLSLIRLDTLPARKVGEKIQLEGVRGVIGRADKLIVCPDDVLPLLRHLLGTTWLVDALPTALELLNFCGPGLRFVTSHCELIDGDGTLTIGAQHATPGIVSRRSEMQATRAEIEHYTHQHRESQSEIQRLLHRIDQLAPQVRQLDSDVQALNKALSNQQVRAQNAVSRLDDLEQQSRKIADELQVLQTTQSQVEPSLMQATEQVDRLRVQISEIEKELEGFESQVTSLQNELAKATEQLTVDRVAQARAEHRLESCQATLEQCSRSQQERRQAVADTVEEIARLSQRESTFELETLLLSSQLADAFLCCEAEEIRLESLAIEAGMLRSQRTTLHKHHESMHRAVEKIAQRRQAIELELQRNIETRDALIKRLFEDYQFELPQLAVAEAISSNADRLRIEAETSELRQELSSVGAVNLTALAELDELQARYDHLHGQHQDLTAAKESLQRIIHKINADSRRLFLETLEVIRQNFQKLYRKSFGGGSADIVLDAGEDVLECGVDIVATPPGKTALSNSLLSGGEKALTAVALLLAIFQYRPSPFCVLDEVDAPFDEANIGRFVSVLSEFLDWTKFIVVTHSKKTMTAANTLYGVTMQESGVSKQVAVRFEDVTDDGHIHPAPATPTFPRKAA